MYFAMNTSYFRFYSFCISTTFSERDSIIWMQRCDHEISVICIKTMQPFDGRYPDIGTRCCVTIRRAKATPICSLIVFIRIHEEQRFAVVCRRASDRFRSESGRLYSDCKATSLPPWQACGVKVIDYCTISTNIYRSAQAMWLCKTFIKHFYNSASTLKLCTDEAGIESEINLAIQPIKLCRK